MPQDEFSQYLRKADSQDEFAKYARKAQQDVNVTPPTSHVSRAPTGVNAWLGNLENDVRYGTTETFPGRMLHAMGARGLNMGHAEGVTDFMASPVLGPIHTVQGLAETPSHPVRGPLKAAGGALETLTFPAAFAGPEVAEAKIPDASRAIGRFKQVMSVARDKPVDIAGPGNVALQIDKMAQQGGSLPKVVRNFISRVTDPGKGPLTYEEARGFYENATRLSADEMSRLTPHVKQMVGKFTQSLGESIRGTVAEAGELEKFNAAMSEYYRAMKMQRQMAALKKYVVKAMPYVGTAYLADKIIHDR